MELKYFHYADQQTINTHCNSREGESKLGETVSFGINWKVAQAQFVVLGIQESIGVKANLGIAGTHSAWDAYLSSFLNVQHTDRLNGSNIHILGAFDFSAFADINASVNDYREATEKMDEQVFPVIEEIIAAGKTPIIIGGSHANAYPIIKGAFLGKNRKPIHVINMDAHADFRRKEGRHSGNPFRFAKEAGFMEKYTMLGLHENYNSQAMLTDMAKHKDIHHYFWEDIFLRNKISFDDAFQDLVEITQGSCGIELDLDSVEGVLSSAMSPSGFSSTQARQFAYRCGRQTEATYLHLCEASSQLENSLSSGTTGKLLSYLVTDFIKGVSEKN
ncbi:formimidoylglutamase [Marivirga sp. S37H4]|uniref:Formimidoylglutamase n=1 Tax=Marivirga aurantiaca TaxID=2802615 RepID=A0A934WVB3_9BACT|nr:formimidoylglutamase [Marivirga aurantiaca]MBK6263703.1 formimidoylglutamase [Marivirga aurantiaca]